MEEEISMGNIIERYSEGIFENIKHVNEYKQEFWYARELQEVLGYSQWRSFKEVIEKAMDYCENSGNAIDDHFAEVRKMVPIKKVPHIDNIYKRVYNIHKQSMHFVKTKEPPWNQNIQFFILNNS
ncbi:MAG: BRO family protein [Eubacterium sp.]